MIKYVQTLNHTKQQKITNTTVAKRKQKKTREKQKRNPPVANIMHVPKSHPIGVTKDLIECMITGFNQNTKQHRRERIKQEEREQVLAKR
jgi:hypothetical protein